MADSREDEIYSTMFSSLKHPVRRKILRMLGNKPMTFMEMVEELGVSTPHLTYHLDSLGDLVSKLDNNQYKLSAFGLATINAMKGVEEVHEIEPKRHGPTFKWKTISAALIIAVVLLAGVAELQSANVNQVLASKQSLLQENQQLMSWGMGDDSAERFIENVTQINTTNYSISALPSTLQYRTDFGGVTEGNIQYSLTSLTSNLKIAVRFRDNHFSRYELDMIESSPIFSQVQADNVLQNAKNILANYKVYSGDAYLTNMSDLLANVTSINNTNNPDIVQGNMKLQIVVSGGTVNFNWMYTQNGIDYQAKGLQMTFQNNVLTILQDGYFLFTVGNTNLATSQEWAVNTAETYVKTMTYTIEGQKVSGFNVVKEPLSVQLVPRPRGDSVALIPYWYVELCLTSIYAGGYNEVAIGIYADTGQVADVQLLTASA